MKNHKSPHYVETCRVCNGTGIDNQKKDSKKCSVCNGTGKIGRWFSDDSWIRDCRNANKL